MQPYIAFYKSTLPADNSKNWMGRILNTLTNRLRAKCGVADDIDQYNFPWHELTIQQLITLKEELIKEGKSAETINNYFSCLRRVLEFALIEEFVGDRYFAKAKIVLMTIKSNARNQKKKTVSKGTFSVKKLKENINKCVKKSDKSTTEGVISKKNLDRLFKSIGKKNPVDVRNLLILALMVYAGLRREEVATFIWDDIDDEKRILNIIGKGNKPRKIPIDKVLFAYLIIWAETVENADGDLSEASPVIKHVSRSGKILPKGLTNDAIYKIILKIGNDEGIPNLHPHMFRSYFITEQLYRGIDISTIAKMVGHDDVNTTRTYDKRDLSSSRKAIDSRRTA